METALRAPDVGGDEKRDEIGGALIVGGSHLGVRGRTRPSNRRLRVALTATLAVKPRPKSRSGVGHRTFHGLELVEVRHSGQEEGFLIVGQTRN